MSDSFASWITLSALIASIGWYFYQSQKRDIHHIAMCCASGVLCFIGGFLVSGAVMKVTGPFANAIVPALLVCVGTALCVVTHTLFLKRQTAASKPFANATLDSTSDSASDSTTNTTTK